MKSDIKLSKGPLTHSMNLKSGAHIHLIGICGTAMASLAGLLKTQGFKVSGSDNNVYPPMSTQLLELGIKIQEGYKKENLEPRPDLVIVGNVISKINPEAQALLESDIPYTSLPKAMGEFAIQNRHCIVAAGTHGKTTCTSMMVKVSDQCKKNAGFMIGGIPLDYGRSFRMADGDFFIIEGDEYDTAFFDKVPKFIHYKPRSVILTSVEFDHADIYKDLDAVIAAFKMLIDLIPQDGLLVAYGDNKNVMNLVKHAKCKVVTYGVNAATGTHYQIVERQMIDGRNHFGVKVGDRKIANIALKFSGEHNALNATAVFAIANELGWQVNQALQGLADFKGVKRRQEVIGTPSGITLVEDFAHHPTAVKVTIDAVREKYLPAADAAKVSGSRLICLFEPRSATSRRKYFQKDYVDAFQAGDVIILAQAFDQTKISETDRFSTAELVQDLKTSGKDAHELPDVDSIVKKVKALTKKGDVILIMSNGGFGGIYQKLLSNL
jgi:UDP-N-acetylmuramate: L-alanyl-gamma-D-glutamyl-meso-diaminopimelate ligase